MARRAVLSLAASAIIGIGLIGTISTDASAYRAGVYRGGATAAVSIAVAFTVVATTVVFARGWRSASVLPPSVLLRSVLPPRVLITPPAITVLLRRSVVRTATIIMLPAIAAYPRHSSCIHDFDTWPLLTEWFASRLVAQRIKQTRTSKSVTQFEHERHVTGRLFVRQ